MVTGREQEVMVEGKEDGRGWWKGRDKKRVTDRERGKGGCRGTRKAGIKDGDGQGTRGEERRMDGTERRGYGVIKNGSGTEGSVN